MLIGVWIICFVGRRVINYVSSHSDLSCLQPRAWCIQAARTPIFFRPLQLLKQQIASAITKKTAPSLAWERALVLFPLRPSHASDDGTWDLARSIGYRLVLLLTSRHPTRVESVWGPERINDVRPVGSNSLSQSAPTGHNRQLIICWQRAPSSRAKYYSGVVGSLTHTFQWHITHSATTMGRSACVRDAHLPAPFSRTWLWLKVSY